MREELTETLKEFGIEPAGMGFIAGIDSETDHANTSGKELVFAAETGISEMIRVLNPFSWNSPSRRWSTEGSFSPCSLSSPAATSSAGEPRRDRR